MHRPGGVCCSQNRELARLRFHTGATACSHGVLQSSLDLRLRASHGAANAQPGLAAFASSRCSARHGLYREPVCPTWVPSPWLVRRARWLRKPLPALRGGSWLRRPPRRKRQPETGRVQDHAIACRATGVLRPCEAARALWHV